MEERAEISKVRLEKWLWAARFYRTRALATQAADGGKIQVNGQRTKPARPISIGDELRIRRGDTEYVIIVEALSKSRGPAALAQTLYRETEQSVALRLEQQALKASLPQAPEHRPDKNARRQIVRFIRRRPPS